MKKIESVIKRKNFLTVQTHLNAIGTYIIDKQNLDDGSIYDESRDYPIGSTGLKTDSLTKIEMVVSDKDTRRVVKMISTNSSLSLTHGGEIFVPEMEEIKDIGLDIGEHAESAYSDDEEFKLDMDTYTKDSKEMMKYFERRNNGEF